MPKHSFSLRVRLLASFGAVAFAGALSGGVSVLGLQAVNQHAMTLYDKHLLGLSAIKEAEIHLIQVARFRAQYARAGDAASRDKYRALFEHHLTATEESLTKAAPTLVSERDQQGLREVQSKLAVYKPYGREFLDAVAKTDFPAVSSELETRNQTAITTFQPVTDGLSELATHKEEVGGTAARAITDTYEHVRWLVVAAALTTVALAIWLGIRLATRLMLQLGGEPDEAVHIARQVSAGHLSERIKTRPGDTSSVLAAMKEMQERLCALVGGIRGSADSIATASIQIASGNGDLSGRTEHQASRLQQTSSTMEELSSTVSHNAETAKQAASMATAASTVAQEGGAAVGRVVSTMSEISEASRRIGDIIAVIDGIAFQTNILALNAAVEAARAGEQGRGFAVVATEVRALAQRSSQAAKEIKQLINASTEKVETGGAQVADAGRKMEEIVQHVQNVSELISEISAATAQQTVGIAQVEEAVSQLDEMTQQNAALVEQSAAAADSLSQQAGELVASARVFRLTGGQ